MTKLKSKKMTKSTFAIIIMAVVMVAMLAFGGTYAYFTAQANSHTSNVTTAVVKLTSGTAQNVTVANAVTGTPILGAVSYDATGTTTKTFVFVTMTATITKSDKTEVEDADVTFADVFGGLTVQNGWTPLTVDGLDANTTVYYQVYDPDNASNFKGSFLTALTVTASPNWVVGQDMPNEMDCDISLTVSAESVQAIKDYSGENGAAVEFDAAGAYAAIA